MSRIQRIARDYKDAPSTNDVVYLLSKINSLKETLEKIEQETVASWVADLASNGLKKLND